MATRHFDPVIINGTHSISFTVTEDEGLCPRSVMIKTDLGATEQAILDLFAEAVSIGLQWEIPLEYYVDRFVGKGFEPSGLIQWHDDIPSATSVIDYVFRVLAIAYLGRKESVPGRKNPKRIVRRVKTRFRIHDPITPPPRHHRR